MLCRDDLIFCHIIASRGRDIEIDVTTQFNTPNRSLLVTNKKFQSIQERRDIKRTFQEDVKFLPLFTNRAVPDR